MGTRIHKRLGYGYVTGPGDDRSVTDMLNPASFLLNESNFPFASREEAIADFIAFAERWEKEHEDRRPLLMDAAMLKMTEDPQQRARDFDLHYLVSASDNDEDDSPQGKDIFVLTPVGMRKEWYRYDDIIDYIEDMSIAQNYDLTDSIHVLDGGIWPHSGTYIRLDTCERVGPHIMDWIRARNDEKARYASMDQLAQWAGFKDHEEAERLVRAKPSDDAVVLALWAEVFKDPEDAYRMQSLLYKYWR